MEKFNIWFGSVDAEHDIACLSKVKRKFDRQLDNKLVAFGRISSSGEILSAARLLGNNLADIFRLFIRGEADRKWMCDGEDIVLIEHNTYIENQYIFREIKDSREFNAALDVDDYEQALQHTQSIAPYVYDMVKDKLIRALILYPDKEPEVETIIDDVDSLQNIVGGYFDFTYPFGDPVAIVCDDEGKIKQYTPNRFLYSDGWIYDLLVGTVILIGLNVDEGEVRSLSDEEIEKYKILMGLEKCGFRENYKTFLKQYPSNPFH